VKRREGKKTTKTNERSVEIGIHREQRCVLTDLNDLRSRAAIGLESKENIFDQPGHPPHDKERNAWDVRRE
jgi:hypothetical protein